MVSIILTTQVEDYARFVHLRYSFKQLLQTFGQHEIIVVDNSAYEGHSRGNKTVSYQFFQQYRTQIAYFAQATNVGMGAAKNIGASAAMGDYLMFVDNDFFYTTPYWLETICYLHTPGTILSPMGVHGKYHLAVEGPVTRVSKFSPGCFFIDRETYGSYKWDEGHPIPGRHLRKHFKDTPQYILSKPLVEHEGYDIKRSDR